MEDDNKSCVVCMSAPVHLQAGFQHSSRPYCRCTLASSLQCTCCSASGQWSAEVHRKSRVWGVDCKAVNFWLESSELMKACPTQTIGLSMQTV